MIIEANQDEFLMIQDCEFKTIPKTDQGGLVMMLLVIFVFCLICWIISKRRK